MLSLIFNQQKIWKQEKKVENYDHVMHSVFYKLSEKLYNWFYFCWQEGSRLHYVPTDIRSNSKTQVVICTYLLEIFELEKHDGFVNLQVMRQLQVLRVLHLLYTPISTMQILVNFSREMYGLISGHSLSSSLTSSTSLWKSVCIEQILQQS